jgi:hypothetical protein
MSPEPLNAGAAQQAYITARNAYEAALRRLRGLRSLPERTAAKAEIAKAREAMDAAKQAYDDAATQANAARAKAEKAVVIDVAARETINNVRQAGEQIDDAVLNLVDAVADLARSQAAMGEVCLQTQQAFNRANGMLLAVLARKLNGFGGFRGDKRMLPESFFATYSQHLPQED